MNTIQSYLVDVAKFAIKNASGNLIKSSNIDILDIASSTKELLDYLETNTVHLESKIKVSHQFVGVKKVSLNLGDSEPIFINPS